jgi:hypothetical protein
MYDTTVTEAHTTPAPARRRIWLRIFLTGLVLWTLTVVVTFVTGNPNLIPTLVLLGSFLVPVSFVAWAFACTAANSPPSCCSARSSPAASSACWRRHCWSRTW